MLMSFVSTREPGVLRTILEALRPCSASSTSKSVCKAARDWRSWSSSAFSMPARVPGANNPVRLEEATDSDDVVAQHVAITP